jgi:hypothetical protein
MNMIINADTVTIRKWKNIYLEEEPNRRVLGNSYKRNVLLQTLYIQRWSHQVYSGV